MLCWPTILRLLHFISANIQVNKGCAYYSRGRHIRELWSKSNHENDLNVNCSLREFMTVRLQCDPWFEQTTHLSTSFLSNIRKGTRRCTQSSEQCRGQNTLFWVFSRFRRAATSIEGSEFPGNLLTRQKSKIRKTIKAADVPFRRPLADCASGMEHGSEF
jgi:hypothetical protein